VLWVPGGTPLGSGRLGVAIPVTAGWSLGLKAAHGADAFVICHTGDAGWISGQALNGMIAASLHGAPVAMVMHRNGIQLSGTTAQIMNKDPRPNRDESRHRGPRDSVAARSPAAVQAYARAYELAQNGKPSLIYPVGFQNQTVADFAGRYGIQQEAEQLLPPRPRLSIATRVPRARLADELSAIRTRCSECHFLRQRAARRRSAS
jgi:hypothetical protein